MLLHYVIFHSFESDSATCLSLRHVKFFMTYTVFVLVCRLHLLLTALEKQHLIFKKCKQEIAERRALHKSLAKMKRTESMETLLC